MTSKAPNRRQERARPSKSEAAPAVSGKRIKVPGGTVEIGSNPGAPYRDPSIEPLLASVEMEGFEIDALPYPNDPARPPRVEVSQSEASRLCAKTGGRLCTELEWEYACKGPTDQEYAPGNSWPVRCDSHPTECVSIWGVRAMGTWREWTSSMVAETPEYSGGYAMRGGGDGAGGKRCGYRSRNTSPKGDALTTFRCCVGPEPRGAIAAIPSFPRLVRTPKIREPAEWAKIAEALPELGPSEEVHPASPEALRAVQAKSGLVEGMEFLEEPVLYSPSLGLRVQAVSGTSKEGTFVAALYPLTTGEYRRAALLILKQAAPVALIYRPAEGALYGSTCTTCKGESSKLVSDRGGTMHFAPNVP